MIFVITKEQIEQVRLSEATESDVDLSSFKERKTFNQKLWLENGKLVPKVRKKLLDIADDFMSFINLDQKHCEDILFVGSLANYNWSRYSDIDLHILVDFKKVNKNVDLVREYFDAKKTVWNDNRDELRIYGFPVEVYVQDVNEDNSSIGIYSIESNKWIKKPNQNENKIDVVSIKRKVSELMTEVEELKDKFESAKSNEQINNISKKVESVYKKIKRLRKTGLDSGKGEFSVGNIVFKALRRSGYIAMIHDIRRQSYNKLNSLS